MLNDKENPNQNSSWVMNTLCRISLLGVAGFRRFSGLVITSW